MNSIFEEEETLLSRRPLLSKMLTPIPIESNSSIAIGSVMSDLTYQTEGSGDRKRTKSEAAQRAQSILRPTNRIGKIPFFRPYLIGLNVLTYGLIIIDPLDRLE